jgi:predicted acylesterase/phospholipase RssA
VRFVYLEERALGIISRPSYTSFSHPEMLITLTSFGVIKAFLEADLLPRVITGTSAGGIVAALLCTRTDDELKELLVPELADRITACSESITVWMRRLIKTGARFSTLEWARKVCL